MILYISCVYISVIRINTSSIFFTSGEETSEDVLSLFTILSISVTGIGSCSGDSSRNIFCIIFVFLSFSFSRFEAIKDTDAPPPCDDDCT